MFPPAIAYITVRKVYSLGKDNVPARAILLLTTKKSPDHSACIF